MRIPGWLSGKESAANVGETGSIPDPGIPYAMQQLSLWACEAPQLWACALEPEAATTEAWAP